MHEVSSGFKWFGSVWCIQPIVFEKCSWPWHIGINQQMTNMFWTADELLIVSASVANSSMAMHRVCIYRKGLKISATFSLSSILKGLWTWLLSIDQHLANKFCKNLQAQTLTISATLTNGAVAMHEVSSGFKWFGSVWCIQPIVFEKCSWPWHIGINQQMTNKFWTADELLIVSASVANSSMAMHRVCIYRKGLKISATFSLSLILKGLWTWLLSIDQHLANKFCKNLQA